MKWNETTPQSLNLSSFFVHPLSAHPRQSRRNAATLQDEEGHIRIEHVLEQIYIQRII